MKAKSRGEREYFLTFTDDRTGYVWVYVLKQKNQYFKEWRVMVEAVTGGYKVITLRTDNGKYVSIEFESYLKTAGIRHQYTVPRKPEQNGVAE